MENIRNHELELTKYALEQMEKVQGITLYGAKELEKRGGVISFNFNDVHPHDVGTIIDKDGVAIRSGHHCAQVLMEKLNVAATNRASFYIYTTKEEIDVLITALQNVAKVFKL
jgi:cysteine desulfurase/selenocysteine lyase